MAQISDRPITKAQVRAIHVALHWLGIDDDTYRERLEHVYGVRTCKDLTRRQAHELLRAFGWRLGKPPGSRSTADRLAAMSPSKTAVAAGRHAPALAGAAPADRRAPRRGRLARA